MSAPPLQDQVIVIVGGTGGLGASATQACLDAGARVVAVGRDPVRVGRLTSQMPDRLIGISGDARDPETAKQAVRCATESFGRLDGLYHIAGGSGRSFGDGPLHQVSAEAWRQTLTLNLDSATWSLHAALNYWMQSGVPGSALLMSSVLARYPAPAYFATHAYAAAKAALEGLVRTCAAYYAPYHIRVNAVAPALVETPMSERACHDPAILDYVRHRQALDGGRVGRPADLDAAVVYFLSPQSQFVTGQVLAVDGGWSVRDAMPPQPAPSPKSS